MRRSLAILLLAPLLLAWLPKEPPQQGGPWTMRQTGRVATIPGITSFSCDSDSCDWTSYGAETCVGSQDVGSDFSTGGSTGGTDAVSQAETTVYTLTCTSVAGQAVATDEVVVGGGGAGVYYDQPSKNIFDTYDSNCDPAAAPANGIIMCDGFEDGTMHVDNAIDGSDMTAQDDYWAAAFGPPFPDPQTGKAFAECRTGAIDTATATYGVAGSLCASTTGWGQNFSDYASVGQQGWHRTNINGTNPASSPSTCSEDISVRFYFRMVGTQSYRCPGGYGTCPAFAETGGPSSNPNGWKFFEMTPNITDGGIFGPVFGTQNKADSVSSLNHIFKFADDAASTPAVLAEQDYPSGDWFNHIAARGEWIFAEVRYRVVDNDQRYMLWMDSCGADGLGCGPGTAKTTPTLRIDSGALNVVNTGGLGGGHGICSIWWNVSNGGIASGEVLSDAWAIRDWEVNATPVGFMPNVTVTP